MSINIDYDPFFPRVPMESSWVFAPHIPLQTTPTFPNLDDALRNRRDAELAGLKLEPIKMRAKF